MPDVLSVPVYYDYLDDVYCEMTEYHFNTEENANKFRLKAVEIHDMVFVCPYYKNKNTYSRIFQNVQDAVDDLMIFLTGSKCSGQYIYKVPLIYLQLLIYQSECIYLKEELCELRSKLGKKEI